MENKKCNNIFVIPIENLKILVEVLLMPMCIYIVWKKD